MMAKMVASVCRLFFGIQSPVQTRALDSLTLSCARSARGITSTTQSSAGATMHDTRIGFIPRSTVHALLAFLLSTILAERRLASTRRYRQVFGTAPCGSHYLWRPTLVV